MPIASNIIGLAWAELRVEGSSTDVPGLQESVMLEKLDQADKEWRRKLRLHQTEQTYRRKGEAGIDLEEDTKLAADVAAEATSLTVDDGSVLGSSGVAAIWDQNLPDLFEFTGRSGNALSGVDGIGWAHEQNDPVQGLYILPASFHSFRSENSAPDGVRTAGGLPLWFSSDPPQGRFFSRYDTSDRTYLWLPRGLGDSVRVTFNKKGDTIDSMEDEVDVEEEYKFFHVNRLIAHGKRARGDNIQKMTLRDGTIRDQDDYAADLILLEAHAERNVGKFVRTRPIRLRGTYADPSLTQPSD